MAKVRSDASRFPSNYGGGWISPAQYITECLCVLIARQDKKALSDQFWQHAPWDRLYRGQIPSAVALLKDYHPNVIIAALRDRRCWKIKSLRARWLLDPILKEKAAAQELQDAQPVQTMEKTSTVQKPRQVKGNKSLLTLLRESENESRPD